MRASSLQVDLQFDPEKSHVGAAKILLEIRDEHGKAVEGLDILVKGDMTHAGMTPVFGESIELGDGRYILPIEWSMAGDWVIQIITDLPDGRSLNRSFDVRVASE